MYVCMYIYIYVLGINIVANIVITHCASISKYHETFKVKKRTDNATNKRV